LSTRNLAYRILLSVLALTLLVRFSASAQKLNYEVVSAYVYNFTRLIEWPHDNNTSNDFIIGVYGQSDVTPMLNKYISSKHVGSRNIVVKVVNTAEEIGICSIVFLPSNQSSKIKQLAEQVKGKPVLIISEKEGMSKKGASITIFLDEDDDDKTKFDISKSTITSCGLIISNNLLRLAAQVY
jgi:hypothetical protein